MKVLFLCSGGSSCRSQVAKIILQNFSPNIEVFSLGAEKTNCPNQMVFELMEEFGYELADDCAHNVDDYTAITFDYLITIYDMAAEKLPRLPIQFVHKLHLDFDDPEKTTGHYINKTEAYRHLIVEIQTELDYFCRHMLKANSAV